MDWMRKDLESLLLYSNNSAFNSVM